MKDFILIVKQLNFLCFFYRLTNLIYVAPERSNTDKYRILIDLIKCARNHRCINAVSVGINQVLYMRIILFTDQRTPRQKAFFDLVLICSVA